MLIKEITIYESDKVMKKILVVGGGITGLSAAYYIQKQLKEEQLYHEVRLVEASDRLGGKIGTVKRDGFTIERGPDSFLARKKAAVDLINELGLENQLVRNATGQSYIFVNGKLQKIPAGSFMGIPTEVQPFLFSRLFSIKGKLQASLDYIKPKGKRQADQSLGLFFRRRFGDELVENLIEPLLSGIYSGDIDDMSLMATFPNFYELEQKHGSLIKGLRKTMPKKPKSKVKKRPGMFLTLKDGFESIVESLEKSLSNIISKGISVDHIEKKADRYHVLLSDATVYEADAIIVTVPHREVGKMFSQYDVFRELEDLPNSSVANVSLAFDEKAIHHKIKGTGFVVSRNSDLRITATTWTERKWPHSTPEGKVLLRSYVGGPHDPEAVNLSDQELIKLVKQDLSPLVSFKGEEDFAIVNRFANAMPQYTVGHPQRIERMNDFINKHLQGVKVIGSSFTGVGVPDCIAAGKNAALEIIDDMKR